MRRVLVAGVGNVFFGDDGFGPEVIRALSARALPTGVTVADFGIRAVHLAFELLEPWDEVIVVDAVARGGLPGTLYVIEPAVEEGAAQVGAGPHGMDLRAVLAQARATGAPLPPVTVVGCEPRELDEGMGTSAAIRDAIPGAVALVLELLDRGSASARGGLREEGR